MFKPFKNAVNRVVAKEDVSPILRFLLKAVLLLSIISLIFPVVLSNFFFQAILGITVFQLMIYTSAAANFSKLHSREAG